VRREKRQVFDKLYASYGKRVFDLVLAILALAVFAPLLALLAICVRLKIGSSVLFCQERPGLHGKPFTLLKFRTMTNASDANGNLLPDAERLTDFGRFLRSSSLDELPELINVLRGEMSLVGPRPLLMQYLPRYTPEQARRHEAKPGITGWAQVNGRNAVTWDERFKLDVWYVDHLTLLLDVNTLLLTIVKVIKREGISAENHVTMLEFQGSQMAEK
jgi:sugar transferase EpsL